MYLDEKHLITSLSRMINFREMHDRVDNYRGKSINIIRSRENAGRVNVQGF